MTLFGAPIAHEDHAQRACHASFSIQKSIKEYSKKVKKSHDIDFKMRIGLNTGLVIVGSVGDDLKMDYTAIGDTVNLASRMETSAKPGTTLVSENVYRIAKNYFEFKPIGKMKLKGKKKPHEVYELIGTGEAETRLEASEAKGLTRFVGRINSMGMLQEALDKSKSGSGQVVGIVGDAGVGKSRLLLEMRNSLSPNEFTYLEGRCLQYGGNIIYMPILDMLKSYFKITDDDSEAVIKKKLQKRV